MAPEQRKLISKGIYRLVNKKLDRCLGNSKEGTGVGASNSTELSTVSDLHANKNVIVWLLNAFLWFSKMAPKKF